MTLEDQIATLQQLVPEWAVKSSQQIRGKYTSGEYIEYQLRRIFGPHGWGFSILAGPDLTTISETQAYAQVTGRLQVTFADGRQVTQDAVGVWPLKASKAAHGGTLENGTSAERYETVLKAACTDALKAAAERIGSCFRPMTDLELVDHIKRDHFRQTPAGQSVNGQSPEESMEDLYGSQGPPEAAQEALPDNDHTKGDVYALANRVLAAKVPPEHIREILATAGETGNWSAAYDTLESLIPAEAA